MTGVLYGGSSPWPELSRVRCEYCARTQTITVEGNCRGCGAPLPEPVRAGDWLEVTTMSDRKPQFIRPA